MTSTERRRTWSERLDPRNWSLVAKLAVVGLVPTVLALTIGAVRVVDQANVAEELGQGSGLVEAHQQVEALTQAVQAERAAAVTFVGGNRLGDRNAVDSAQGATDQAVQRANDTLAVAQQQAPQLATAQRQAETTLGQLPIIRSQVAAAPTPATDITTRYTSVVQRTLALDRALLGQLQTSDTAGLATALASTASATEALELERSVLDGAIAAGQLEESQKAVVTGAEASYQAAASDYQAALTPQQVDQFGNFATDAANLNRQNLRDSIMATPAGGRVTADPAAWNAAVDSSAEVVRASDRQAEEQFIGGRAQAAEEAGNTAGLNSVLLMLGLVLTIGIILLLGRQLVRSLRVLRTSALDVAERRLPQAVQSMRAGQAPSALVEPVPLESRDEIGEVARAFDAVHGQAIRLAADQAALQQNVNSMFVNLSRRSQALVERQLQLIEQLESNEQDPDQLSNLFQLDHLATRMRRNSENLLVLAGTDLAKRNVAPVQVVDVLRAAVSEVEQYQRVVVQTPPTATIAGRAANDVVHLLAELLDNATNFSPPDSQVVMSTTRTADESLLIEIADRGVGMADSELADANQRLGGPSEVDVSASRRMGLFVVGRLAARHRIGVRLSSASGAGRSGGLSASVTVPPQLVPSAAPIVEQPSDAGGTDERAAAASGAWPVPVDRQAVAANGAVRNGSPSSAVAGVDGPVPPTFGSGNAAGSSRNGSAPKLPTRTPGSALRHNPGSPSAPGSTDGQEAAPNGSSVRGASAFMPSGPPPDGGRTDAGDVFTPASDGLSSGTAEAPPRDPRWPSGGRAGATGTSGAGREGDHGDAPGGPDPDADAAARSRSEDVTGRIEAADAATTAPASDRDAPADADPDSSGRPPEGSANHTGRTVFGAAAAAGAGGALAGYFGRGGEPDGPGTEEIARIDDSGDATPDRALAEGPEDDGTTDAFPQDDDRSTDTPDATVTDEPDTVATDTGDADGDATPEASDASDAEDEDGSDAEPSHEAAVRAWPTAAPEQGHEAETDGDSAESTTGEDVDGETVPAEHDADEPDPESESDTTAFPAVRPPREPMGGARPAPGRTGPPPPAPSRRPVMPGTGSAPRPPEEQRRPAVAQGSAPQDVDALFAPAVDVEGGRGQLRRPGGLESARGGSGYDISQTTPIFEEMASAWFRSNRSVPVRWEDRESGRGGQAIGGQGAPGDEQVRPGAMPGPGPRPTPAPRPGASAAPAGPGAAAGNASPGVDDAGFASPADDLWRQAAVGAEGTEQTPDELTSAGLPKRRPRARLLPGSAAGSTALSTPVMSEPRNAENVRGRLASYQQGVRQGRESAAGRTERTGSDTPEQQSGDRSNPSDHEEST